MKELTPKKIVAFLDKYIIGQEKAKKAVAIALRNRTRRKKVAGELQKEISPKNIIMIGNTGIGKTEIARRIAALSDAPFVKIEATKFTEVGYVGRDVESIIRDLVNVAINNERKKVFSQSENKIEVLVEDKILQYLIPHNPSNNQEGDKNTFQNTTEKFRKKLRQGELEEKEIMISIKKKSASPFSGGMMNFSQMDDLKDMSGMIKNFFDSMPKKQITQKLKIKDARKVLKEEIQEDFINQEEIINQAIQKTENFGIVFLDEIDKIVSKDNHKGGPEISREGVQRDILPLVEGSSVSTRYGVVKTDHILFIAAGAFHMSSPSDIIPELQGRFPIRVELEPLTQKDLEAILVEPKNSLIKQYTALLSTEGVTLTFTKPAIKEIAKIAFDVNNRNKNLGARRLATVMEKLLEEILFEAPQVTSKITISDTYVKEKLANLAVDEKLAQYIL